MAQITYNLPWIESPFFERELAESNLSDEDKAFVKFFAENGYVVFDPQIPEEVLTGVLDDLNPKVFEEKKMSKHFSPHRILDGWNFSDNIKKIATAPAVLEKLQLLYRRKPIPFQTLNFDRGTQQGTHSDMIHFSSIPERFMCGVWLALEDTTEDNGPLHYYPGSHKLPFYEMVDMGVKASDSKKMKNGYMDYTDYYEVFIQEVIKNLGLEKKKLIIKKGQALIWAANLLHGGESINVPGATRHSQVSHYYFEDCTYYTPLFTDLAIKKIFLRKIVDISTGKRVPNKYFGSTVKDTLSNTIVDTIADMIPKPILRMYRSMRGRQ